MQKLMPDEDYRKLALDAAMFKKALTGHQKDMQVLGAYRAPYTSSTPQQALLPTEPAERKRIPIWSGVIAYFPDAIVEIAKVSQAGNEQHNPGQPLHWAREKSTDQEDTIMRHLMEAGRIDSDGQRHTAKAAWRILAKLQLELEAAKGSQDAGKADQST